MLTGHQHRGNLHIILQIRPFDGIAQPDLDRRRLDIGLDPLSPIEHRGGGMIAQVLANAQKLVDYEHPDTLELCSRADSGEQEHIKRANDPTAQHDLLPFHRKALTAAFDLYTNGAFAVK